MRTEQELQDIVRDLDVTDCARVDVDVLMRCSRRSRHSERWAVAAVLLVLVAGSAGALWSLRPAPEGPSAAGPTAVAQPSTTPITDPGGPTSPSPGPGGVEPRTRIAVPAGGVVDLAGTGATVTFSVGRVCLIGLIPPESLVAVRCATTSELTGTTTVVARSAAWGPTAVFFGVTTCDAQAVDYYVKDASSRFRVAGQVYEVGRGPGAFCAYAVVTPSSGGSPPSGDLAFSAASPLIPTPLPMAFVTVPDVVGLSLDEARERLNTVGLNRLRTTPTPDVLNSAVVVAQSPMPGSTMAPMNEVVLTVAPITTRTAG